MGDVHIHLTSGDAVVAFFETFFSNNQNFKTVMATLADIQAQNKALIDAVAAEDTQIGSTITLIQGLNKQLADLQAQLTAAIAANDPAAIQAVADSMASTVADVNAKTKALADASVANTPAA